MNKAKLMKHMAALLADNMCIDPHTGEVNTTMLAETTAWDLKHDEWLDDELHAVWDAAVDAEDAWKIRTGRNL